MSRTLEFIAVMLWAVTLSSQPAAQTLKVSEPLPAQAERKAEPPPEPKETQSVTRGTLTLDGNRVDHTATAGTLVLRDAEGKARATVFYVAYTRDGVEDLIYEFSTRVHENWAWNENANKFANVAEDLRSAMTRNPALKVLFASGYYDLATPYFDTPFSVAQMGLPRHLRGNVTIAYYEAGHMMYIRKADHTKFKKDVAGFVRSALSR